MKNVLIYLSSENIAEKDFSDTLRIINGIGCENGELTLIACKSGVEFAQIFKSAVRKNNVFISNSLYKLACDYNSEIFKKLRILSTVSNDLNDGFTAAYGAKTVICLSSIKSKTKKLICNAVGRFIFPDSQFISSKIILVSEYNFLEIERIIKNNFSFRNPCVKAVNFGENSGIFIFSGARQQEYADELCTECEKSVLSLLGDNAYSDNLTDISEVVVNRLIERDIKVATAESCTAGLLSSAITSVPNSSKVFEIGIASYSNRIKNAALGVSKETLRVYGAVSPQTACEMAIGIKELSDADIGLAVTGVAGPDKSEGKNVGTVYISLADGKNAWVIKFDFGEDSSRDEIRRRSTYELLDLLRRYLLCLPYEMPGAIQPGEPIVPLFNQPHFDLPAADLIDGYPISSPAKEYRENNDSDDNYKIGESVGCEGLSQSPETALSTDSSSEPFFKSSNFSAFAALCLNNIKKVFSKISVKKETAISGIFFTVIALIIACCLFFASYFIISSHNESIIADARESWKFAEIKNANGKYTAINEIQKTNKDIAGWIKIGDTQINNPVCIAENNKYYKNHNFKRQLSPFGSLFFDSSCRFENGYESSNIVIYGKNAKDGSMFGELKNYKTLKFLKANSEINLVLPYSNGNFHIFSVMILSEGDNEGFTYNKTSFTDENDYMNWISQVKIRSLFNVSVAIPSDSKFLTLVTDSSEFKGAKLVIVGFKTTQEMSVSDYSSLISVNPSPRYPSAWYDKHSAENPFENYSGYTYSSDTEQTSQNIERPDTVPSDEAPADASSSGTSSNNSASSSKVSVTKPINSQGSSQSSSAASSSSSESPSSSNPPSSQESSSENSSGASESSSASSDTESTISDNSSQTTTE